MQTEFGKRFSTPYSILLQLNSLSEAHCGSIRKTALLAKRTLMLIVVEQRPKQLMKPDMQFKMYLLSKQGHMIEAESIIALTWTILKHELFILFSS